MDELKGLSKDELLDLLRDGALNWLAHDGLWFRAAEQRLGMEAAMDLDREAWRSFTVIEAKRIMKRLGMASGGGIPALVRALGYRLYARVNEQEVVEQSATHCVFRMRTCRVQDARKRQGLADFPCKSVGIVEYSGFARTIDERIETTCLACPPDPKPEGAWCVWEFRLLPSFEKNGTLGYKTGDGSRQGRRASMSDHGRRNVSRREFLKAAALGAGAGLVGLDRLAFSGGPALARPTAKRIPIGVQIYSVRGAAGKDFPGVIEAIAKLGYEGVEFAGYYGWESRPKELRKLLDDNGLKCCGTHTGLNTITGDALGATAELHAALGNPYLIVPSLVAANEAGWLDLARKFNDILPRAEALGMRIGYHAHAHDFKIMGEKTSWETFFDNTDKRVLMQMDTGNCLAGGGDPVAMLKKYPGRSLTVHLKEHGGPEHAVIGQGDVPWKEVFEACETAGGTLWYIVEHETTPNVLDGIKGSIEGLRKLGK